MKVLQDVQSLDLPARVLIGARTFAVDRIVPELERMILPARRTEAGRILIEVPDESVEVERYARGRRDKVLASRSTARLDADVTFFDFRSDGLDNWSHALNYALPLLLAAEAEGVPGGAASRLGVLASDDLPDRTRDLFEMFGFAVARTNQAVLGRVGRIVIEPNDARLGAWKRILFDAERPMPFDADADPGLPRKVFIPRRERRTVRNEAEVLGALRERGYEAVLPERLSPRDQLALHFRATDVVAVHGAGLAPMLYRKPGRPFSLVELFNAGHVTNFFHAMAFQLGGRYAAVRGEQTAKVVKDAYAYGAGVGPFNKHSLDSFVVDVEAMLLAIDVVQASSPGREAEQLAATSRAAGRQDLGVARDARPASISSSMAATSSSGTSVL